MSEVEMDLKGLKCPQPILKIQSKVATVDSGTVIKAIADCSSFEKDLKKWTSKMGKTLLECTQNGEIWTARIKV